MYCMFWGIFDDSCQYWMMILNINYIITQIKQFKESFIALLLIESKLLLDNITFHKLKENIYCQINVIDNTNVFPGTEMEC